MSPRGRGAAVNPTNRFETLSLHVLPEHVQELVTEDPDALTRPVPTLVYHDRTRSILNRVDSPDIPFTWSLNPYRGCEHGCTYCYARPGHEYLGLSCGLDFETRIIAKPDAAALLRAHLASRSWMPQTIACSGVTDPYQPVERTLGITRAVLEVFRETRHPVGVITKSRLVTRDIDLLQELARVGAAAVAISVTTLDNRLAAAMEPRASSPAARLAAIRELAGAGVPVTVMTAPMIPGLNDHELPSLLEAARDAGATSAGYVLLRLPHQLRDVFFNWLARTFPERAPRVERALRDARGGAISDSVFHRRMRGTGARADSIAATFKLFARRFDLDRERPPLRTDAFVRPAPPARDRPDTSGQLTLF